MVSRDDVDSAVQCLSDGKGLANFFPAKSFAYEFEEVDKGKIAWMEVRIIQCLGVRAEQFKHVVPVAPHIHLFAGVGADQRRGAGTAEGFDDHDKAPIRSKGEVGIGVSLWLPPRQRRFPKARLKSAVERPTEGDQNWR